MSGYKGHITGGLFIILLALNVAGLYLHLTWPHIMLYAAVAVIVCPLA